MASIIDGNVIAAQVRASVASRVASLKGHGITPGLAVILVGDDPASHSYVTMKERDCQEVGIASRDLRRPADISQEQLESLIDECNNSA